METIKWNCLKKFNTLKFNKNHGEVYMKTFIIAAICLIATQNAHARRNICPKNSKEIVACTSKQTLPMIPFISLCEEPNKDHVLAIDYGSNRGPDHYEADVIETDAQIVAVVKDEDMDKSKLIIAKSQTNTTQAVFSYEWLGREISSLYKCSL